VNGWDVRPTLDRAGAKAIACSSGRIIRDRLTTPQALIQRCQRLSYELRLCEPVILWWSAPQHVASDSAVAQPTMVFFTCLVLAPELTGETPSRHITLHRSTPRENGARRAGLFHVPISLNLTRSRQVGPTSRSISALNSRSVSTPYSSHVRGPEFALARVNDPGAIVESGRGFRSFRSGPWCSRTNQ